MKDIGNIFLLLFIDRINIIFNKVYMLCVPICFHKS